MSDIERLIIVVLGSWDANINVGWYQLHSNKFSNCEDRNTCCHDILFINCNNGITVSESKSNSYDMVFIREDFNKGDTEGFLRNIKQIIESNLDKQVAIAVHHTSGRLVEVRSVVDKFENVHPPKEFSRIKEEENKIWKKLEPLIESIVNKDCTKYGEIFDTLWRCLAPKPSEVAHSLRSEILTPFIPFHLFHQLDNRESLSTDKEWQNIFEECCSAINNTNKEKNIEEKFNKLKELKDDISADIKNCAYKKFTELKKYFRIGENGCTNNVEKNDCRKTIEDFAQCLEKIVNCIESGEESSDKK